MNDGSPHGYVPDPHSLAAPPLCLCGHPKNYRDHQPLWWRLAHRHQMWRWA